MRLGVLPARWIAPLEQRMARWVRRRQGEDRLPVTLQRRRLYILPTRAGGGFAVLLLAMLVAGLNYANSLALLLTFVLGGFAIVGMNRCHRNLLGLRVTSVHVSPTFAGEPMRVRIDLQADAAERLDLAVEATGQDARLARLEAGADAQLELRLPTSRRGRRHLRRLRLTTQFPFGLFRCWTWLHISSVALVYPRPIGALPLPVGPAGRESGQALADGGRDELRDLRPFRDGDSPRQVAWKAYARGQPLLVKEYSGATAESLRLDYDALPGLDTEARLAQLCRWALDAEAGGRRYALFLPGLSLEADRGAAHLARCLAALAQHPGAGDEGLHD